MRFLEDIISEFAKEGIYSAFKWLGIFCKWIFYAGHKSVQHIEKENWNRRIGFFVFCTVFCIIYYFIN